MEWESRLEESGFRELGLDCEGLTKEFRLYSWLREIQQQLLSGYNQIYLLAGGEWNEERQE